MNNNYDIEINFKVITDNSTDKTKTKEEFEEFLEDQIQSLELQFENYIAFVIDNINDTESANRAILLRLNSGDTQIFYNSTDTYLKSKSKLEEATDSDYGVMSPHDHAVLYNLDQNMNTDEANSILNQNNEVLKDIIEIDDEKTITNTNKIYKFKDGKISTIEDIKNQLEDQNESLSNIEDFLNADSDMMSNYTNLQEYIDRIISDSVSNIIDGYINHTHL